MPRTPAQQLDAIERWSRRTFYASAISAVCLMIIAAWYLFWEVQALRVAGAIAEAGAKTGGAAPPDGKGGVRFDPARGMGDLKKSIFGGGE